MSDTLEKFKETPTFCPNCGAKESMYPLLSLDKGVDRIRKCRRCGYEIVLENPHGDVGNGKVQNA